VVKPSDEEGDRKEDEDGSVAGQKEAVQEWGVS
jgi:hypothetical protein